MSAGPDEPIEPAAPSRHLLESREVNPVDRSVYGARWESWYRARNAGIVLFVAGWALTVGFGRRPLVLLLGAVGTFLAAALAGFAGRRARRYKAAYHGVDPCSDAVDRLATPPVAERMANDAFGKVPDRDPWPDVTECHGHNDDEPRCPQCRGGHLHTWRRGRLRRGTAPIRCVSCGARKCDRADCSRRRHHPGDHHASGAVAPYREH